MMSSQLPAREIDQIVRWALSEDLGDAGDVTSKSLLATAHKSKARIIAKESGVIAGLSVAQRVFEILDDRVQFFGRVQDGQMVAKGDRVAEIEGPAASLLTGERTALNFLQRLSGIATLTAQFAQSVKHTHARILDTRKTTPGLRLLEKYAVRVGGGLNHRFGLFDMVLIKENHIQAAGGISEAVNQIRQKLRQDLKIEVETRNLQEVEEALKLPVDRIMLDNMSLEQIREAVKLVKHRVELEVSGGVSLDSVREIAETGVDFISVGALTHSARALDLSLLVD